MTDNTQSEQTPYDEVERGKYVSLLADHPGYVKFPVPLDGRHYKAWNKAKKDAEELESLWQDWRAAVALIDEWAIEGVAKSDITPDGDNVPLEVINWVRLVSLVYILDATSLKNLQAPSESA